MIHGATGIGDYPPLSDKTDPFAGIFVDGFQVGLTTTRWNNYTPIWQTRISFSVDQEAQSMICLAVFDRGTVDGSDDGASLDEMSTKNGLIDYSCMNVIGWGGGDETWTCSTASCPSVTLTDQTVKLSDDTDVKVTYDIEITTSHPPPPSPSPPPPSYSSRRYLEALLEALLEARAPIALLHQILRRSESPGLLPAFWGVWAARSSAVCSPTSVTFANARRLQADVLPRMRSAMRHGARLRLAPKPTPMLYPSKWSRPLPVPR